MTDVLRDRRPTPPGPAAEPPSVVLHGALAAFAAALSGLAVLAAVVLVAWVADTRSGSSGGDAVRAAADAWLLAHGGGLRLPSGRVAGVPLGLTLLAAVVLHRAGATLARAVDVVDLRSAARATGALAAVYGLTAVVVARVAATATVSASAVPAGIGAVLLAAVVGGLGVIRGADLSGALRAALPARVPALARAAGAAVLALLAAGLLLVLGSLGGHAGRVGDLVGALDPGLVGGGVLLVGCVLLLPNAALWAVAYAAGPGFAVGVGTGISPFGAVLGPVPAFPLLAALPPDGTPPPAVRAVLLLPVLAGVAAGIVLVRSLPPGAAPGQADSADAGGTDDAADADDAGEAEGAEVAPRARGAGDAEGGLRRMLRTAGWGLAAGFAAAAALALLATLAGGRLGDGYLAAVGPSPWQVLLALGLEVGIPAAITAALLPAGEQVGTAARGPTGHQAVDGAAPTDGGSGAGEPERPAPDDR